MDTGVLSYYWMLDSSPLIITRLVLIDKNKAAVASNMIMLEMLVMMNAQLQTISSERSGIKDWRGIEAG
jgi:hypothetical protein